MTPTPITARPTNELDAIRTAAAWHAEQPLFLDTETTGLDDLAEICEIAVVDHNGTVLLDSLVKPVRPIPGQATDIHGITNKMVQDAPSFTTILPTLLQLVTGKPLLIYNRAYDMRLIYQSAKAVGVANGSALPVKFSGCVMDTYAQFYGAWNDYHQSYTYQRLDNALRQCRLLPPADLAMHRARTDAECTRLLVNHLAGLAASVAPE